MQMKYFRENIKFHKNMAKGVLNETKYKHLVLTFSTFVGNNSNGFCGKHLKFFTNLLLFSTVPS